MSSFHVDPDHDFMQGLQVKSGRFLQALSAPPCGLRHPFGLRRQAHFCWNLTDVRVCWPGRFNTSNLEFSLVPEDLASLNEDVP